MTYTFNPSQPAQLTDTPSPPATELPIGLSGRREALTFTSGLQSEMGARASAGACGSHMHYRSVIEHEVLINI